MNQSQLHLAGHIDQIVRDYFLANPNLQEIRAKNLMPLFIEKGIFEKDHRNGLPIRDFLRLLDKENQLSLLSHCHVVRNEKNRNWCFMK